MTNIEKICKEVIEASDMAGATKWEFSSSLFNTSKIWNVDDDSALYLRSESTTPLMFETTKYLVTSANNAPKLAKALIRAMGGLKFIHEGHCDSHKKGPEHCDCQSGMLSSNIEKLFSEEGK